MEDKTTLVNLFCNLVFLKMSVTMISFIRNNFSAVSESNHFYIEIRILEGEFSLLL